MAEPQQYGGFWARLVALILDNAIVFLMLLATLLSMVTVAATVGLEGVLGVIAWMVGTFLPFLYWPVLESSRWRATLGKRIMGLEVTDLDGNRLSFLHALLRSLAKIISGIPLGIGFLIAAFTARKQALHDIIVKTLVVRTGPSQLWKVLLALIIGFVLMVAAAAGLFYWVVMPMFKSGFGDAVKVEMKGAPQVTTIPSPAPSSVPAARAPAAPQASAPAPAAGKEGPDPEFDAVAGKPLTGMEKPGTTRAGPAILALDAVFPSTVWLKVYLPVPALGDPQLLPAPVVAVDRVLDSAGKDYYDTDSNFEKGEFFKRATLSYATTPVPHLAGTRNVHVKAGLSEQSLQKIEGRVSFTVPVDPRSVFIAAQETGKEMRLHDATVSLKSVLGNVATLRFRGASEHMLLVRGYGADDKMLAVEGRSMLPAKRDVDDDFSITFKGPPVKLQIEVAARVIERVFPFSVVRGAVAGPPASADGGVTLPPRTRATSQAASAPAAAPATAPAKPAAAPAAPESKPAMKPVEPKPEPKAALVVKPEPKAAPVARPVPEPAAKVRPRPAAPVAAPAPQRPLGQADSGCVYKPVMTDEEIARCRR